VKKRKAGHLHQTKLFEKHTTAVTQKELDSLIKNFIVEGMHSLSTVEQPAFVKLVEAPNPLLSVMSRRTLGRRIEEDYTTRIFDVKRELKNQLFICTTADIWSTKTRSFMGVTAHWISQSTLERHSVAIACKRFHGVHDYLRITECLEEIYSDFGIGTDSIVATVTDNGSNFVKAFKEFGVKVANNIDFVEDDGMEFHHREDIIDNDNTAHSSSEDEDAMDATTEHSLPHHQRCACHTLSLIGTTDAKKALKTPSFAKINHTTMGKCSALWNASGRPKAAEAIHKIISHQLVTPCATRWNSLYDSICGLLRWKSQLGEMCEVLSLPKLKDTEIEFLEEYKKVLEPIAIALDRLQGDKSCFYGMLLPTLLTIKRQLTKITNLKFCAALLDEVTRGLQKRFENMFALDKSANEAIIAACCHPLFKLRWLPVTADKDRIQMLLLNAAKALSPSLSPSAPPTTHKEDSADGYFEFFERGDEPTPASANTVDLEVLHFLSDTRVSVDMLSSYPAVLKVFLRYNVILPSSAPVERLFSFAGMINSPNRRRLNDELFEMLVVLKQNKAKSV
jgi:hypothetical protein